VVGALPAVQEPAEQQKPPPQVPLPAPPHAPAHAPAAQVGVPPEQTAQAAPVAPQAPLPVPAWHVPPAPQQPPLHAVSFAPPHAAPHVCVLVSHAWPVGQSAGAAHPQTPLVQASPAALIVQSWQAPPALPHSILLVPATHMPPMSQQPPLQALWPAPHAAPHTCVPVLHASPAGQSAATLHPHVPAARHAVPFAFAVQLTQVAPADPQSAVVFPVWQVDDVLSQQPTTHGMVGPQGVGVHTCVVVLQVWFGAQSALVPHPQVPPVTHIPPFGLPAQSTQTLPVPPHSGTVLPATHVSVIASQQPPLHGCVAEHIAVHVLVVVSHDWPIGQSVAVLQPHLLGVPVTHAVPAALLVQLVQTAVPVLQAPPPVPGWQVPPVAAEQQPVLQTWVAEHIAVHVWVVVSHASPAGQSAVAPHPHAPLASHTAPWVLMVQSTHAAPEAPHDVSLTAAHVLAALQQKPVPQAAPLAAPFGAHVLVHAPSVHVGVPPPHATHAPPALPHAPFAVPTTQLPLALQHPPLQAESFAPPHAV